MTVNVDVSLWPVLFGVVFFSLLPWVREIVDRLVPKAPDEASLKKLSERVGILELSAGVRRNG